ncbi:hypothetical protein BGZ95_011284 [Linnemannia exigua]|uniref:Uncharacterized protein n=1 Tax=Linnemannia exigua TaxID=604196 RepID=A0AAD4H6J6_9FUNG|nr:hypothetical protein BGZ95_011284 [Linnemannia exigua]
MKISVVATALAAIICVSALAIPADQAKPQAATGATDVSSPSSTDPVPFAWGDEFKCFKVDASNKISITNNDSCTLAEAREDALAFLDKHKDSFPRVPFRLARNYIDLIPDFAEGKALAEYFGILSDMLSKTVNFLERK